MYFKSNHKLIDILNEPSNSKNPKLRSKPNPNPNETQFHIISKVQIQVKTNFTTHHISLTECKTFSSGEINSRLTQRTITKQKGYKHILTDRAMPTQGINHGPNALEYVEVLKLQTDKPHSHPEIPGIHTAPK